MRRLWARISGQTPAPAPTPPAEPEQSRASTVAPTWAPVLPNPVEVDDPPLPGSWNLSLTPKLPPAVAPSPATSPVPSTSKTIPPSAPGVKDAVSCPPAVASSNSAPGPDPAPAYPSTVPSSTTPPPKPTIGSSKQDKATHASTAPANRPNTATVNLKPRTAPSSNPSSASHPPPTSSNVPARTGSRRLSSGSPPSSHTNPPSSSHTRPKPAQDTNTVPFVASRTSSSRSPPRVAQERPSTQPTPQTTRTFPPSTTGTLPARRRLSSPSDAGAPPGPLAAGIGMGNLPHARRSASSLVASLAPSTTSFGTIASTQSFGPFNDPRSQSLGATWANLTNTELVMNIGSRERTRQEVLWEIVASEQRHVDELLRAQDLYINYLLHPHRFTQLQHVSTSSEAGNPLTPTTSIATSSARSPRTSSKKMFGRKSGASTSSNEKSESSHKARSSQARAPKDPFELGIAVPLPVAVRSVLEAIAGPEGLVAVHNSLAMALRQRYEVQYPLVRSLADVFAAHAGMLLDAYTAYAVSLGVALSQLDEARMMARALRGKTLRKEAQALADTVLLGRAVAKLETTASSSPGPQVSRGTGANPSNSTAPSLSVALARPLQRLLKYPLLAQNLLFHTDPSTAEFEATVDMVAKVEVLVRKVQAQKVSADSLDATLDAMARIEGITDRKLLKPSDTRTLLTESPAYPVPAPPRTDSTPAPPTETKRSDSNPTPSPFNASQPQLRPSIKPKRSLRRLSDLWDHPPEEGSRPREGSLPASIASPSTTGGRVLSALGQGLGSFLSSADEKAPSLGSKRDLWSVKFSDVELRCQRIGVTTLPMASSAALRPEGTTELSADESLTRRAKESKDRLKALRTETLRTPSRNLYKFIGVVTWNKERRNPAVPAPETDTDEAATRSALLAGTNVSWDLHDVLAEEEEEWDESDDDGSDGSLEEDESDLELGPNFAPFLLQNSFHGKRALDHHALLRPDDEEDESEVLANLDPVDESTLTWPTIRDIDDEMLPGITPPKSNGILGHGTAFSGKALVAGATRSNKDLQEVHV